MSRDNDLKQEILQQIAMLQESRQKEVKFVQEIIQTHKPQRVFVWKGNNRFETRDMFNAITLSKKHLGKWDVEVNYDTNSVSLVPWSNKQQQTQKIHTKYYR
jgi:hypothetical protein